MQQWISLDGYLTDKDGGLNFFADLFADQNKYSDNDQLQFLDRVDTFILGRKTYELFVEFWPTATTEQEVIADRLNELDKVVVSKTLKSAPWGNRPNATLISNDPVLAIRDLKINEGKDIVIWGSVSLSQTLYEANLIDELHFRLCPVITGGGRNFFKTEGESRQLILNEIKHYANPGVVNLQYLVNYK